MAEIYKIYCDQQFFLYGSVWQCMAVYGVWRMAYGRLIVTRPLKAKCILFLKGFDF